MLNRVFYIDVKQEINLKNIPEQTMLAICTKSLSFHNKILTYSHSVSQWTSLPLYIFRPICNLFYEHFKTFIPYFFSLNLFFFILINVTWKSSSKTNGAIMFLCFFLHYHIIYIYIYISLLNFYPPNQITGNIPFLL